MRLLLACLRQAYQPKVFKAPDGTSFATRRQVFKYWFNFTDREGETLVGAMWPVEHAYTLC